MHSLITAVGCLRQALSKGVHGWQTDHFARLICVL